jgi:hypothetical protein
MDSITCIPAVSLVPQGPVTQRFIDLGLANLRDVASYIKDMPYGYNEDQDNPIVLLDEGRGTCTTKHGLFALCAAEMNIPIFKALGIYLMTEQTVSGIKKILGELDAIPALHCFLVYGPYRIDLTEGNCNGKNGHLNCYEHIWVPEAPPTKAECDIFFNAYLENYVKTCKSDLRPELFRERLDQCVEILKSNIACSVK